LGCLLTGGASRLQLRRECGTFKLGLHVKHDAFEQPPQVELVLQQHWHLAGVRSPAGGGTV
jgi:hypothetical protein